jgi:hypothetical protein
MAIKKEFRIKKDTLFNRTLANRIAMIPELQEKEPEPEGSGTLLFPRKKKPVEKPVEKVAEVAKPLEREPIKRDPIVSAATESFRSGDKLNKNTLAGIHFTESSSGTMMGKNKAGSEGPAGHFQMTKQVAAKQGLSTSSGSDERFDLDKSSQAAASYLKGLNRLFTKSTVLAKGIKTIPVTNAVERKKFTTASYNGGQGLVAKAQAQASLAGDDPTSWDIVKRYLKAAGASPEREKEMTEYVHKITKYEQQQLARK